MRADHERSNELKWEEPLAYRRLKFRAIERSKPLQPIGFACFVFLTLVAVRFIAGLNPQPGHHPPGWPLVIPVCLAVALFTAFGLPRIAGRFTKYMAILSDQGINLNTSGYQTKRSFYPWETVGLCQFSTEIFCNERFEIVNVFGRDGNWLRDLALNGNTDSVRRYLVDRGAMVE